MRRRVPRKIRPIVEEVKAKLREIYGQRLKGVILYGSYAREEGGEGSDIDLIILLDEMQDLYAERERYFNAILEIDDKYDALISIIPFQESEFNRRRLPIILNAKREGIAL